MSNILISAGDAITARLIQEAGFDGIWISGFEASARLGLKDDGSITMTEMLNVAKPIVQSVSIPVFVDCDTGYGSLQRTVDEFGLIGVAGICIEDNTPDKENSLWGGSRPLVDSNIFSLKIKSLKRKIKLIARTEALIRGFGIKEAINRAEQYSDAGADIILIHTRDVTGEEAKLIKELWKKSTPLAIVPTKFPQIKNSELSAYGYQYIIWANQTERVKIKAIRDSLTNIKENDGAFEIENGLSATLEDMRVLANGV